MPKTRDDGKRARPKPTPEHATPTTQNSPFLIEGEAAVFLRLKAGTLQNKRLSGKGPAYLKLGGRVVYEPATLLEWARAQQRTSTSDESAA